MKEIAYKILLATFPDVFYDEKMNQLGCWICVLGGFRKDFFIGVASSEACYINIVGHCYKCHILTLLEEPVFLANDFLTRRVRCSSYCFQSATQNSF